MVARQRSNNSNKKVLSVSPNKPQKPEETKQQTDKSKNSISPEKDAVSRLDKKESPKKTFQENYLRTNSEEIDFVPRSKSGGVTILKTANSLQNFVISNIKITGTDSNGQNEDQLHRLEVTADESEDLDLVSLDDPEEKAKLELIKQQKSETFRDNIDAGEPGKLEPEINDEDSFLPQKNADKPYAIENNHRKPSCLKMLDSDDSEEEGKDLIMQETDLTVPGIVTAQGNIYQGFERQITKIVQDNPPLPLFPKSRLFRDSPKSGGTCHFLKITKFRGQDDGKSMFQKTEVETDEIYFSQGTTLKDIFSPFPTPKDMASTAQRDAYLCGTSNENYQQLKRANAEADTQNAEQKESSQPSKTMTQFGEIVFLRHALDFNFKKTSKRDQVIEENLLDVKKLLQQASKPVPQKMVDPDEPFNTKDQSKKAAPAKVSVEPYYNRKSPLDRTLIFESRFESGNLAAALKAAEDDYYLLLQNDVNTNGHTQWFFFRASNKFTGNTRFSMLNLCKPDSLYNEGMRILVYSEKKAAEKDIGWHREGENISYYRNGICKNDSAKSIASNKSYYTHTFTYNFEYENDVVYFAYCYPYTYSDMIEDLNKISSDPIKSQFCQRKTLCNSLAGNKCEYLTITSKQNPENMARRKGVIITARVHPGESVGSWMMKGALEFLTDTTSPEAELLRQNFVFKVLPMLNPDGVINGNYRCSLAGCDLNRRWKAPSKVLHPTIYYTKQLIHAFAKERDLAIFCDFHGHSRRKNIFMYGCHINSSPEDTRLFPFILSTICPYFTYNNCRYGNQKSKESTARMAIFNELKQHPAIYTMESSFCGNDIGPYKNYHFSTKNLKQTGIDFCRALLIYQAVPSPPSILENLLSSISQIYEHYQSEANPQALDPDKEHMKLYKEKMDLFVEKHNFVNTKQIRKSLIYVLRQHSDVVTDGESTSSAGSDNAPSEDNMEPEEIAEVIPIMEDPNLAAELQRRLAKLEITKQNADTSKIVSPFKRRQTMLNPQHKKLNLVAKVKPKKFDDDPVPIEEEIPKKEVTPQAKPEEPKEEETVQKKKLKKNVESKDASTQTDRSDYFLIKQKQKEKEQKILQQLAKQGQIPADLPPEKIKEILRAVHMQKQMLVQEQANQRNQTTLAQGSNQPQSQVGSAPRIAGKVASLSASKTYGNVSQGEEKGSDSIQNTSMNRPPPQKIAQSGQKPTGAIASLTSQGLTVNRNAQSSQSPNKNRKLGAPGTQYSEQLVQSLQETGEGHSSSKRLIDRQDSLGAQAQAADKSSILGYTQASAKNQHLNQKLQEQTVQWAQNSLQSSVLPKIDNQISNVIQKPLSNNFRSKKAKGAGDMVQVDLGFQTQDSVPRSQLAVPGPVMTVQPKSKSSQQITKNLSAAIQGKGNPGGLSQNQNRQMLHQVAQPTQNSFAPQTGVSAEAEKKISDRQNIKADAAIISGHAYNQFGDVQTASQIQQYFVLENQFIKQTLETQQKEMRRQQELDFPPTMSLTATADQQKSYGQKDMTKAPQPSVHKRGQGTTSKSLSKSMARTHMQHFSQSHTGNFAMNQSANQSYGRQTNDRQYSVGGQRGNNYGQNQFFHVQRIVPATSSDTSGNQGQSKSGSQGTGAGFGNSQNTKQGVKINIVNVHNEFNIQNNIIFEQPQASQAKKSRKSTAQNQSSGLGKAARH